MFKAFLGALTIVLVISAIGYGVLLMRADQGKDAPLPGPVLNQPTGRSPWTPDEGWAGVKIPEFTMVDRDGAPRDQSVLEGKVSIVTFFFTHCTSVCPAMHGVMFDLEEELKDTGVQFVSISVDPVHDTPQRVDEYASGFGADPLRWVFLIPDRETLDRVVVDELKFNLSVDEQVLATTGGGEMQNIVHPSHLFLIGPDRQVLGTYVYRFQEPVAALSQRARRLATELSRR